MYSTRCIWQWYSILHTFLWLLPAVPHAFMLSFPPISISFHSPSTHTAPPPPPPYPLPLSLKAAVRDIIHPVQLSPQGSHIGCLSPQGPHYFFAECLLQMEKWQDQNVWCLVKKGEYCHGRLNWDSISHAHLISNKKWTLQIHKFAIKLLQAFVHFYCFGSFSRGNDSACIKGLRSADIRLQVIPVD